MSAIMRVLSGFAASALVLSCALFAISCVQSPDESPTAEPGEAQGSRGAELTTERVGEAAQDWTKADCYAMWRHNSELCNSAPPDLRAECFAACAVMLGACLAAAEG